VIACLHVRSGSRAHLDRFGGSPPNPPISPGELRGLRSPSSIAAALALSACAIAGSARADDPEAARAAYDRGTRAFEAKRYPEAAVEFARADALAPNAVALGSALKTAALADDPVLGMTLADRAELRVGAGEAALAAARRLREKFADRTGKLLIRCAAVRACTATVDTDPSRRAATLGHRGRSCGRDHGWGCGGALHGDRPRGQGRGVAGARASRGTGARGAEPGGAVARGARGSADHGARRSSLGSIGNNRRARHLSRVVLDRRRRDRRARRGGRRIGRRYAAQAHRLREPRHRRSQLGQAAQTRTNVLLGVTGAAALATAAVGIFAVRWSRTDGGTPGAAAALALCPGPGGVAVRGRF